MKENTRSNSRIILLVSLLVWMISSLPLLAQEVQVQGRVTDTNTGEVLPGVNVIIKGTTRGETTDFDGMYSITAPAGSVLQFSFIGYKTSEVLATPGTINVKMSLDIAELDEIILIGYGTQKKSDRTGAVAHVRAEDMVGGVLTDPIQGLQGQSAGVLITKKGGDPNSGFAVKIRGASGFDSNTQPLFVVDGVSGVDPTTIAPEDIESFNILKDAASTAIYGSRGSNGVIIIQTKRGKAGLSQIQFNSKVSFDQTAKRLDLLTASELRAYAQENNLNMVDGGADTDWQDEIYRTGFTQSYNLNYSGGTDNSNYYASLTHADWQGVLKGTGKKRTTARINLQQKGLKDKLIVSGSLGAAFEDNDYENYEAYNKDDIIYQAYTRNPTDPVYNPDGSYYITSREFNYENPVATINEIKNLRDAKRYFGTMKTDLEIISGLVGSVNIGYTRDDHVSSYFRPKNLYATADNGYASKTYNNKTQKLLESTLTYNSQIGEYHNITGLVGYSWNEMVYNGFKAGGENPSSPYIGDDNLGGLVTVRRSDIESNKGMWRLIGAFGRVQYNYQSRYYIAGSIRRDGSTKFGSENRWGWFPTGAAGWNIDKEDFMADIRWLSQLKLRFSYGVSGNQEIGEYNSQVIFKPSGLSVNPETGQSVVTYDQPHIENPFLRWERTSEYNLGLDFAVFRNRISGSIEFYLKNTDDLLGRYAVPVPPNPARTVFANSGKIENKGVELNIQVFAVDQSNLKWRTVLNGAYNKQKMLDLGEYAPKDGVRKEGYLSGRGLIGDLNYVTGVIKGEELGAFYLPVYAGMSADGAFLFESLSGGYTRDLDKAKRQIVGTPSPDFEFGWNNFVTFYKHWSLDFSFRAMIGNDVYNATRMFFDYNGNIPNLNGLPDAIEWAKKGRTVGPTVADIYVEDASFFRLDYISLGYTVPRLSKMDWFSSLKVYVAANNLFVLTGYSGLDPETTVDGVSFGIDQYNVYPKTRTLSCGLSVTF